MALGATALEVVRLVIARGGRLAVAGTALGIVGGTPVTRVLKGMLFGTSPFDPTVFAAAAILLGAVAVAVSPIPAWRASRVDPLIALRHD
jgi:ABC-type antimicrobial peptide transport system permease subunit